MGCVFSAGDADELVAELVKIDSVEQEFAFAEEDGRDG